MIRGTELLNQHPGVQEAVIARGPLRLPIAYVALADEDRPVASVFAELDEYLAQRLDTGRKVQFVLVGKDPHGRAPLASVVP